MSPSSRFRKRDDDRSAAKARVDRRRRLACPPWRDRDRRAFRKRRRQRDAPRQLDEIAGDVGAGLIVAGAYGHSRFRELILGGMTQYLVTQSARCVLLSH